MAAACTPPRGLTLALFPNRWLPDEHEAGTPANVLGLSFITEGAIPFAARDPRRRLPACIAGSAVAGAISLGVGVTTVVLWPPNVPSSSPPVRQRSTQRSRRPDHVGALACVPLS